MAIGFINDESTHWADVAIEMNKVIIDVKIDFIYGVF
jgi:hypothetical protein